MPQLTAELFHLALEPTLALQHRAVEPIPQPHPKQHPEPALAPIPVLHQYPRDQVEGAEVGSLVVVTMGIQMPTLEWTSTTSFACVVVLLVLLCVLCLGSTATA